jgi:hypothetical protein
VSSETLLWVLGIGAEAGLVLLLALRRVYKTLPAFQVFACWNLLSDLGMFWVRTKIPAGYFQSFELMLIIDSMMIFAVLVELTWSLFKPIRSSLPKRSWIAIVLFVAAIGAIVWPLAGVTVPLSTSVSWRAFFQLQQTVAIVRIVFFLAIVGLSHFFGVGWRNRELQVAAGLGFYSVAALATGLLHTHQSVFSVYYHAIDEALVGFSSLIFAYWLVAFSAKEAERKQFSLQIQQIAIQLAGMAKAGRSVLP